jgi:tagaturonate reductase
VTDRPALARAVADAPRLPERAVQFGTGALLRGLVDDAIDRANRAGRFDGSIVAIGSTGSGRDAMLNAQDGLFTLIEQGIENGQPVERHRVVASISRALSAATDWPAVLDVARDPNIEVVFSNTTEVGIAFDESDVARFPDVPKSFPGKLAAFLVERARTFPAGSGRGIVVIPCELVEDNGARLREIVLRLVAAWSLPAEIGLWIESEVVFANTLVDRIVTGDPGPSEATAWAERLGYSDGMMTVCETYRLLAIEGDDTLRRRLAFVDQGTSEGAIVVPSVAAVRERKVRLLNGAHTAMVSAALLAGFATVRDVMADVRWRAFVERMLFDEILPTVDAPDADRFAHAVLARFSNPYLRHSLVDITLHGTTKMRVRIVPSIRQYVARRGGAPTALAFGFAAFLELLSGEFAERRRLAGESMPADDAASAIVAAWQRLRAGSGDAEALALDVCSNASLWDGAALPRPFTRAVADWLALIRRVGISEALAQLSSEPVLEKTG